MTTNLYTSDIKEIRLKRIVYARWNQFVLEAKGADGMNLLRWVMEDGKFGPAHLPLVVTWEHPEFPEKREEYQVMTTTRETFNVKNCNQSEDPRLTEIRGILESYNDESEDPKSILTSIYEVIYGGPGLDSVASSQVPPPVSVEDDEIKF